MKAEVKLKPIPQEAVAAGKKAIAALEHFSEQLEIDSSIFYEWANVRSMIQEIHSMIK